MNVQLQSTAASSAPCSLQVTPSAIDFGTVVPGAQSLLGAKVLNAGADTCVLQQLSLTDTGGNVFSLPAGSVIGLSMAPGEYFTFEVQFSAPPSPGTFQGMATVNGTGQPPISVPDPRPDRCQLPVGHARVRGLRDRQPGLPGLHPADRGGERLQQPGDDQLGRHRGWQHRR